MASIKYRKREFTPNQNQAGMNHSWFAESVIVNELDTVEIARLIEARTGVRRYEAQRVLASFVELINEECAQSMRIKLTDEKGQKFVSIYPKVSGSISDAEVRANPEKYNGATVATEAMLTSDMLSVALAATVGVNASKKFAQSCRFEKATAQTTSVADEDETTSPDTTQGGTSTNPSQGGGTGDNTQGGNTQGGGTGTIDTGGGTSPSPSQGGGDDENDGGD